MKYHNICQKNLEELLPTEEDINIHIDLEGAEGNE